MLLLACALALCGSVAVVAFAADAPIAEKPRGAPTPSGVPEAPLTGPFALAASRAQSEANAERHRAARAAYSARQEGGYGAGYVGQRYQSGYGNGYVSGGRPRAYDDRYGGRYRVRLIARLAERLDVERPDLWRAVAAARRQISPRTWSDARGEALAILAEELGRPVEEVERAVRIELRREFSDGGNR